MPRQKAHGYILTAAHLLEALRDLVVLCIKQLLFTIFLLYSISDMPRRGNNLQTVAKHSSSVQVPAWLLLLFKKNLTASKPSEHPPQVEECLKV